MMQLLPKQAPKNLIDPIVNFLISLGITPNMLTISGFLGSIFAACMIATENFLIGGIAVLFFSGLDMFDGAVARKTRQNSKYGAILDSTLDRFRSHQRVFFSDRKDSVIDGLKHFRFLKN